jgi:hypothetical protein
MVPVLLGSKLYSSGGSGSGSGSGSATLVAGVAQYATRTMQALETVVEAAMVTESVK